MNLFTADVTQREDDASSEGSDNSCMYKRDEAVFCVEACYRVVTTLNTEPMSDRTSSFGDALLSTITCTVCRDPKKQFLLTCGHHFCGDCITKSTVIMSVNEKNKKKVTAREVKRIYCPDCPEQRWLEDEPMKHQVIDDLYDAIMRDNACKVHPFLTKDYVDCIPCDQLGLCPLWYILSGLCTKRGFAY